MLMLKCKTCGEVFPGIYLAEDKKEDEAVEGEAIARKSIGRHRSADAQHRYRNDRDDGAVPEIGAVIRVEPRLRILLPIQIVQQTGEAPDLLVIAGLARVGPHCGFNRLHVIDERRVLHPFIQQLQRFFAVGHDPP